MAARHGVCHEFFQEIQLAGAAIIILDKECRVAGNLPQAREDGKDPDAIVAAAHVAQG